MSESEASGREAGTLKIVPAVSRFERCATDVCSNYRIAFIRHFYGLASADRLLLRSLHSIPDAAAAAAAGSASSPPPTATEKSK